MFGLKDSAVDVPIMVVARSFSWLKLAVVVIFLEFMADSCLILLGGLLGESKIFFAFFVEACLDVFKRSSSNCSGSKPMICF